MSTPSRPSCAPIAHPTPLCVVQAPNGDQGLTLTIGGKPVVGVGCFHKTLDHNPYGEVIDTEFASLKAAATAADPVAAYNSVPVGTGSGGETRFVNPTAGLATDRLVPPYCTLAMPPAPKALGLSSAAEMVELYWMALLRDLSFSQFATSADAAAAAAEIDAAFSLSHGDEANDVGHLSSPADFAGSITASTLFRGGLPGENEGPHISQFFLRNVFYGAQCIDQRVLPYLPGQDYLTDYGTWLRAQNTGLDARGHSYGNSRPNRMAHVRPLLAPRDLVTFVNQDALHQAYFNAALILDSEGYTPKFPEDTAASKARFNRQALFVTHGGPHLLTLVSEVAARAMKVVWHQKWQVHLRQRPEAYGGLVEMQSVGVGGVTRAYGLPGLVMNSEALQRVRSRHGTGFLPMAFPSGSPAHPAYGAGHATVAGACVTILKAWFKEDAPIKDPVDLIPASEYFPIDLAAHRPRSMPGLPPLLCSKPLTVGGELNKLASNVAMGRSLGGVHWRSDNTRSLRLGEQIAIVLLAREVTDLVEDLPFTFTSFDGDAVTISKSGKISIPTNPPLEAWLNGFVH